MKNTKWISALLKAAVSKQPAGRWVGAPRRMILENSGLTLQNPRKTLENYKAQAE